MKLFIIRPGCIVYISILFSLFSSPGCKKFLEIPPPIDQIQTEKLFSNDQAAVSSITGLYSLMLTSQFWPSNGGITIFGGLSADEIYPVNPGTEIMEFSNNTLQPSNSYINSYLWSHTYRIIYHTNAILEGLDNSSGLSRELKNQLKGEALLVRALHFWYLTNMFGKVPLTTTTSFELNKNLTSSETNEISEQIITDLILAKSLLTPEYPSHGRVRPNKWTAAALLARAYLFKNKWKEAEIEATEIINSGYYSLTNDLNNVFLNNSSEAIWSLMQEKYNTSEGQIFIPIFSFLAPNYSIRPTLLNAFEANDQRKEKWIGSNEIEGQIYYYPNKYKKGYDFTSPAPPVTEFFIVFRLAEQYLIRAEARTQQEDFQGALLDINLIRSRAGLAATPANDKTSILQALEHERRIELFAEWGHRWFDLKRWNKAHAVLSGLKAPSWQQTDTLYPIPLPQIQANPSLVQNEGY